MASLRRFPYVPRLLEGREIFIIEEEIDTLGMQCRICRRVLRMALEVTDYQLVGPVSWTIGTKEEISDTSTCGNHQQFLEYAINDCLGKGAHPSKFTLSFKRKPGGFIEATIHDSWKNYAPGNNHSQRAILISRRDLPDDSTGSSDYYYPNYLVQCRVRHSDFIDPDLLKSWKAARDESHEHICPRTSPCWLVDVEKMCLVPGGGITKSYVALSYVWGQVAVLKATKENIALLQQEGALKRLSDSIPATIQHAMKIVSIIEERYLWVDALCIVQDDEAHLHHQLRCMALIYQNASLTIIAADGDDANHGIRGIQGVSEPRILPPTLKLTEETSVTLSNDTAALRKSTWAQRGWTLQEHLFFNLEAHLR